MVHQLVDRRVDEAGELDLRDRSEALRREPHRQSGNRVLGERRVEDAVRPEPLQEPISRAEHATFGRNVFAEDEDVGVLG